MHSYVVTVCVGTPQLRRSSKRVRFMHQQRSVQRPPSLRIDDKQQSAGRAIKHVRCSTAMMRMAAHACAHAQQVQSTGNHQSPPGKSAQAAVMQDREGPPQAAENASRRRLPCTRVSPAGCDRSCRRDVGRAAQAGASAGAAPLCAERHSHRAQPLRWTLPCRRVGGVVVEVDFACVLRAIRHPAIRAANRVALPGIGILITARIAAWWGAVAATTCATVAAVWGSSSSKAARRTTAVPAVSAFIVTTLQSERSGGRECRGHCCCEPCAKAAL